MNAIPHPSNRRARRRLFAVAGALLLGFGAQGRGAESAPKTHTLFMGVDLAVERDNKLFRVEDVTGTTLLIKPEGKPVHLQQSPRVSIRVNESLKLASEQVVLGKLSVERAYTPENDPFRQFVNAAGAASGQAAMEDLANMNLQAAELQNFYAQRSPDPTVRAEAEANLQGRQAEQVQTLGEASSEMNNVAGHAQRYAVEKAAENFDALRIAFEIKPARSLARPYYIVIAQFRERDAKENTARKWVYAKSIDAIEAGGSRRVDVLQGGFPPGFILENHSVHIYDEGVELATDVSRKRVELTDDEAFQYRVIEYIGANKGVSRPPTVATEQLSRAMSQRIEPGQLSETYYVRVSKDGTVVEAFRDDAGRRALQNPQLESVLKSVRFMPALEAGKPVERIAPLKLGSLSAL